MAQNKKKWNAYHTTFNVSKHNSKTGGRVCFQINKREVDSLGPNMKKKNN